MSGMKADMLGLSSMYLPAHSPLSLKEYGSILFSYIIKIYLRIYILKNYAEFVNCNFFLTKKECLEAAIYIHQYIYINIFLKFNGNIYEDRLFRFGDA